jgi:hypothetical protein
VVATPISKKPNSMNRTLIKTQICCDSDSFRDAGDAYESWAALLIVKKKIVSVDHAIAT